MTTSLNAATTAVQFAEPRLEIERRGDGTLLMRSGHVLQRHPHSVLVWLVHWADVHPHQVLMAERADEGGRRTITYAEALAAVRSLSTALREAGASPSRPLLILSENSIEQALMTWAAQYAGIPVAPMSPAYATASGPLTRLQKAAALIDPWIVFAQDGERFARAFDALGVPPERTVTVRGAPPRGQTFASWAACIAAPDVDAVHMAIDRDAPAKYMFTSGSTGLPKAVVITHGMLAAAQQITAQIVTSRPERTMVQVDWLPWHHVMGGNVVLGRLLYFGGTLYIDDGRPLPGRFAQTLANLREIAPTYYFNVPAGYAMLVAELERDDAFARHMLGSLEFAYFAGASLSEDVHERFQQVAMRTVGRRIVIGTAYASTETTAGVVMRYQEAANTSCIGLPLPGCELKLVPDAATPGRYEMRVRARNVFSQYLNQPEASAGSFDTEGFYKLGDAVRFVDDARPEQGLLFNGRLAEDFKLASGTWVRSSAVRQRLLAACAPLLREVVLAGEGREWIGALAWVDARAVRGALGLPDSVDEATLARHPGLLSMLSERLAVANAGQSGAASRIERLALLAEAPSMEAYELTDKGSINVRAVLDRRAHEVAALYAEPAPAHVAVAVA